MPGIVEDQSDYLGPARWSGQVNRIAALHFQAFLVLGCVQSSPQTGFWKIEAQAALHDAPLPLNELLQQLRTTRIPAARFSSGLPADMKMDATGLSVNCFDVDSMEQSY
jgi:hypothetical protein